MMGIPEFSKGRFIQPEEKSLRKLQENTCGEAALWNYRGLPFLFKARP